MKTLDIKNNVKRRLETAFNKEAQPSVTSYVVSESLDIFLDDLIEYLQSDLSLFQGKQIRTKGLSGPYGQGKAALPGYLLPQLLREFSLLRKVINEELQSQGELSYENRNKVDDAIDTVISLAVTEFVATKQKDMQEALNKAEVSNRDLEHFAGIAAHDLKSPLATISGYLSLLDEELSQIVSIPGQEYMTVIESAAERMRLLIDHLLDYARLAAQERPFKVVDLNEVLKITTQNLHSSIKETDTKIKATPLPLVQGDVELLVQLFQNLFANSIKFRGTAPSIIEVNVDGKKFPQMWLFSVKDHGIGFDPKQKENIFELYTTLNSEKKYPGSGIGLATCKKVVEIHHGRIWAESAPGQGTTFWFTLPRMMDVGSTHIG